MAIKLATIQEVFINDGAFIAWDGKKLITIFLSENVSNFQEGDKLLLLEKDGIIVSVSPINWKKAKANETLKPTGYNTEYDYHEEYA